MVKLGDSQATEKNLISRPAILLTD